MSHTASDLCSCAGQFASTLELAALGPNVVVFNFCQYVFCAGLSIATLRRVHSCVLQHDWPLTSPRCRGCVCADSAGERSVMAGRLRGGDAAGAGRGVAAALAVATGLGVAILVLLSLFGERLICLTGCAPNLVAPALTYLRVRMLAAPAVVITMVAQVRTLPASRLLQVQALA